MRYRTKNLISSKLRRAVRWEFWPMPIFYAPVVTYIVFLCLRYRGLTFLSVNPGLPMSGLIGERKAQTLEQLEGSPFLARFELIPSGQSPEQRTQIANQIMGRLGISFPIILKPDFGQRGADVAVIRDELAMEEYLGQSDTATLLQEHVVGEEFGVFNMRYPAENRSEVFSITEKTFPVVVGDGIKSLEQLLMENPRTHYMAEYLLNLHADKLDLVLPEGDRFQVVEIGSHCRGSVFLDGNQHVTAELARQIDGISRCIDGFNFGRYDIRVDNVRDLQAGERFKVLEVNGVTSESTNIYDPSHSVIDAYRILLRQWRSAFEIGRQSIAEGAPRVSLFEFISHLRKTYA